MVLVLAALYSLYRSNSDRSDESLVDKAKEAILRCSSPSAKEDPPVTEFSMSSSRTTSTTTPPPVIAFTPSVKGEWIDACFGRDFLRPAPVTPHFRIHTAEIPAGSSVHRKVGLTVSRLACGACVRSVVPGSEAAYAGVLVDSVVLAINDRPVLAEPTKSLLERLWQAESPVKLTFIKNGNHCSVLLLGSAPHGIQWSPAAPHLAMVQRVAGAAAEAGVGRGSVLVAVNGRTFRELDHVETAVHVREVFANQQALTLTTALPKVQKPREQREYDGVELKYIPMRLAIGSLCSPMVREPEDEDDVAGAVAAGRMLAPTDAPTVMRRIHEPIPFQPIHMVEGLDPLNALVYCVTFRNVSFDQSRFSRFEPPSDMIGSLHSHDEGISHFLLQFLSLVCASNQNANELTSMLLKASRRDSVFCQRLYFMLRSFIASLEVAGKDSKNLLALLNCLEMLRFAETAVDTPKKDQWQRKKTWKEDNPLDPTSYALLAHSPSTIYDHTSNFLSELDHICDHIAQVLQKTVRQRITNWAWQSGKALDDVTTEMRTTLSQNCTQPLVNPVKNNEMLCSIDPEQCYILPSAHFPILLTFFTSEEEEKEPLYKTTVEALSFTSTAQLEQPERPFVLHACLAGRSASTDSSVNKKVRPGIPRVYHEWEGSDRSVRFEIPSSCPDTLSLRLTSGKHAIGFGWVDVSNQWMRHFSSTRIVTVNLLPSHCAADHFDEHGEITVEQHMQLQLKITTECTTNEGALRRRLLLYKHDDDLRQEAFAVQFIQACDEMLRASGLDLKLMTFQHCPVGSRRGFVEWLPGSIPLSEICHTMGSGIAMHRSESSKESPPKTKRQGLLSRFESIRRLGGGGDGESLRAFVGASRAGSKGSLANNPIQEYLRSIAYDPLAAYFVRQEVMDTYVKSCAGYSVISYILGVGDRHLDNLLLHHSGSFFHCDYSFILGQDPKKFMPMRVTEDMVNGMGGNESGNYAKFLSLSGASFLALRRPENVRVLLSMVRLLDGSCLPDVSSNQSMEEALMGVVERLQLDLDDSDAITFMENLVESSVNNKMWLAVDAMHNLGKRF